MKLNESTDRAVRIMMLLAEHGTVMSSAELTGKEKISQRYLFRIVSKLRAGGLLTATKGPDGGYALAKSAKEISMFDIIQTMEDLSLIPENDIQIDYLPTDNAFVFFRDLFERYLKEITLDVLAKYSEKEWRTLTVNYIVEEKARLFR